MLAGTSSLCAQGLTELLKSHIACFRSVRVALMLHVRDNQGCGHAVASAQSLSKRMPRLIIAPTVS